MKNEELLKPCAHCGSKKISSDLQAVNPYGTSSHCSNYVRCDNCGMGVDFTDGASGMPFQGARELWNHRHPTNENATASSQRASVGLDREKIAILAVKTMNANQVKNGITQPTHEYSICCSCGRCHTAIIIADAICHHFNKPGLELLAEDKAVAVALYVLLNYKGLNSLTNKQQVELSFLIGKEMFAKFGTTVKEVPTKEMISKVLDRMENEIFDIAGFKRTRRSVTSHYTEIIFKLLGGGQ